MWNNFFLVSYLYLRVVSFTIYFFEHGCTWRLSCRVAFRQSFGQKSKYFIKAKRVLTSLCFTYKMTNILTSLKKLFLFVCFKTHFLNLRRLSSGCVLLGAITGQSMDITKGTVKWVFYEFTCFSFIGFMFDRKKSRHIFVKSIVQGFYHSTFNF